MIKKFVANITMDIKGDMPTTEKQWEDFNIDLEKLIEQALENNNNNEHIENAEVILEEI
jgi:hypothetical protein